MRIDLVITELDTGGAERCCAELALFLMRRGHCVRVYALGPRPVPPKDAMHCLLTKNQVDVVYLGGRSAWMFPAVLLRLWSAMRIHKPDVVQSFLWHANVLCAFVVPRFGIPWVGGVRVADPNTSRIWMSSWASKQMDKIVCVSQGVADWCVQKERSNPGKVEVIPNGVEISARVPSFPTQHEVPGDARIILVVGRLNHQKGTDVLVARATELMRRLPTHHLVFLGDGVMRDTVESLANCSTFQDRIHCLGQRDDVRDWMAISELLLLPTRYEGMPNVILESMAEGLPVVSTRVEGIAELLGDHLDEQTVAAEAWNELMDRVVLLANDASQRKLLGMANRQCAQSHFQLEQQLVKYEVIYQNLVALTNK